ncbi:hypothetical protein CTAYLR_009146 [Chrysophaeum taylorii]|uniref:C2H2-type domain-containing protein n=1 Tax=Chrysophaeum taylorii TaxID=2483200 RepID=A0AAD7UL09_9STRA|nr:hypothetical protein CTAYLR_009146 [Chrysophaeum taylorii]
MMDAQAGKRKRDDDGHSGEKAEGFSGVFLRPMAPVSELVSMFAAEEEDAPATRVPTVGPATLEAWVGSEAEVIAVSRLRAGRSIWLSQCPGDVALRVSDVAVAVEVLLHGRRIRVEVSRDEIEKCTTSVQDDSDRQLECGACGLRFGVYRHLRTHVDFHNRTVPDAPKKSRRLRIELAKAHQPVWRAETSVDPTRVSSWTGAAATWEPLADAADPLKGELARTHVLTMRLRTADQIPAIDSIATDVTPEQNTMMSPPPEVDLAAAAAAAPAAEELAPAPNDTALPAELPRTAVSFECDAGEDS